MLIVNFAFRIEYQNVVARFIGLSPPDKSKGAIKHMNQQVRKPTDRMDGHRLKNRQSTWWVWGGMLIILLFTGAARIHLLDVSLERDEGEYAYAGQLILQGIPPYGEVYNMKMPGIYGAYALILLVFGQTHTAIHLGLLVINVATIILLFLLGKKLDNPLAGVIGAGSFAILALSPSVQGFFANAEHFVIFAAVGGLLLLVRAVESSRRNLFFLSGLLLGVAFLIKQHGAAFILCGGFFLLYSEINRRPGILPAAALRCLIFGAGVLIPFGITCLVLLWTGVFEKFWFWTFVYAREYVSSVPISTGLGLLKRQMSAIIGSSLLLWVAAGIGLTALLWDKKVRSRRPFIGLFCLFSFLAICPGLYFRPHYFVLLLPSVALLVGIATSSMDRLFTTAKLPVLRRIPVVLVILALLYSGYGQKEFLFHLTPKEISRAVYGANPFPESLEIAEYIKRNSSENDRIAVIGSEPQIYFYADRRAASGYIYTYALMEKHRYALEMQREMIREIESAHPKFLIFVNVSTSWRVRPDSEKLIFQWAGKYCQKYYDVIGIIDILSNDVTEYRWDDDAEGYAPRSQCWVSVYKCRS